MSDLRLEHALVGAADIGPCRAFYVDALGLRESWAGDCEGSPWIHLAGDGSYLSICQADDPAGRGFRHMGWSTRRLDMLRERLVHAGVEGVERKTDLGTHLYVEDPDGFETELVEYAAGGAGSAEARPSPGSPKLEHVRLNVPDLGRSLRFYRDLLGLRVSWAGRGSEGTPVAWDGKGELPAGIDWLHLRGESGYLSIARSGEPGPSFFHTPGAAFLHLGWETEDLDGIRDRLGKQGEEVRSDQGRHLYLRDPGADPETNLEIVQHFRRPVPLSPAR